MSELTPRQRDIVKLIQESLRDNGMPPTRAEIASAMGFKSANAAEEHLRALQKKGVLDIIPGASRGIQLKDSLREQMGLPIRRYALWQRMLAALGDMAGGAPTTEAAHAAGFSDAAHLSRTFRAMFGVPPSELFKNSRFVQAIPCFEA